MCYAVRMVRFAPFAGLRYDPSRVDLSMVIAPPYDVIPPDERARLAGRHSANSVRVELPEPDHRAGLDRYANAASQLERWQQEEVLRRDPAPAFYAYRMTTPNGHATNGVIGALGVDDSSASDILPHEQTLPKAKSDRLDLLKATRANLSPIWGLSMSHGLTTTFVREGPPDTEAVDDDGVLHQLWVIDDPVTIRDVQQAAESSPIVVADGHHRYETARTYLRQCSLTPAAGSSAGSAAGSTAASIMALVVELAGDQLAVGPIHRGLSRLPDGLDLLDAFSSWFDVTRAGDFDERTVGALGESQSLALLMPSGAWLLSPKDGTPEAAGADLDSSMVALVIAELPDHELEFFNSWQDGMHAVAAEQAQAVVLLRPVSVEQIEAWARDRRQMPPKSTYFYPKPRTGMVFRDLDAPA
jgi:uncharacterized protein (DUF1015 family)